MRYEHQGDEEHTDDGNNHILQGVGPNHDGLVKVHERLVEDRHPEVGDPASDATRGQHGVFRLFKPVGGNVLVQFCAKPHY